VLCCKNVYILHKLLGASMRIGNVFISKVYRLFRDCFILGVSLNFSGHIHLKEDECKTGISATNESCITVEFLLWGVDIQISRN
jgi:hypothetical protein